MRTPFKSQEVSCAWTQHFPSEPKPARTNRGLQRGHPGGVYNEEKPQSLCPSVRSWRER